MVIKAVDASTLYLILPFKVSQLAVLYCRKYGVSSKEAIETIYKSKTYKNLENEKTKYWHYGPVALLQSLEEELPTSPESI